MQSDEFPRRRLLAATAGALAAGLAGCSGLTDDGTETPSHTPTPTPTDPPRVVNASDDDDQNLTVRVRTIDPEGTPVGGVRVRLHDPFGTADTRVGTTDDLGRLVFVESVGPPPCNSLSLALPEHDKYADLGCWNGGVELAETFVAD